MSRDGRRKATLRSRNCEATTAFFNTLDVSVPEDTFQGEASSGELCVAASSDAELRWEGDDLVVTCKLKSCCPDRIESKKETVGKSKIRFEGFEQPKSHSPTTLVGGVW